MPITVTESQIVVVTGGTAPQVVEVGRAGPQGPQGPAGATVTPPVTWTAPTATTTILTTIGATSQTAANIIVRAGASQSGDLQQWQDGTGSVPARVKADGCAVFGPVATTGDTTYAGLSVVGKTNDTHSGITIYANNLTPGLQIGYGGIRSYPGFPSRHFQSVGDLHPQSAHGW